MVKQPSKGSGFIAVHLSDPRLTDSERARLLEIAEKIYGPSVQEASHEKTDRECEAEVGGLLEKLTAAAQAEIDADQILDLFLETSISEDEKNLLLSKKQLSFRTLTHIVRRVVRLRESERSLDAALAKLEADPKQIEKSFVRTCWDEWQRDPNRYKSKAEFARDMLLKCEHLVSQKKIEDWCRLWSSEDRSEPAG